MTGLQSHRLKIIGGVVGALALLSVLLGAVDSLVIGVIVGLVYAAVAMGLVLIYKGSRVVNFAHGQMALLGTFAAWGLIVDPGPLEGQYIERGLPWLLAAACGIVIAGLSGVVVEATVIRRLSRAPRLILLVATLGLGQVLALIVYLIWLRGDDQAGSVRQFPVPFEVNWRVGDIFVLGPHVLAAIAVPILGIALAAFFRWSRTGIAIRAASDNADAARLLGVSVRRVSMITWGLGAALAAVAGILIAPINGGLSVELLGTGLFIRALTAAVLGGLTSLPGAVVGGLAVGIGETLLTRYTSGSGVVEVVLLVAILVVLLLFAAGEDEESRLAFAPPTKALPDWIRAHVSVGAPRFAMRYYFIAGVVVLPLLLKPSGNFTLALMLIYAMVGISLNLLVGTAGQVSLGHFAFLGVGAFAGAKFVESGMWYPLAFALAGLVGGAVAFVVGLPALRIRGLSLAIATLGFAVAAHSWLFTQDFVGARFGLSFDRPVIGPFDLNSPSGREFAYLCLAMVVGFVLITRNLEKRRSGRALLAVRENEKSAAVLGLPVRGYKLLAFTVSGILAAWAGFAYGMLNPPVQANNFPPLRSLELVAMVIIGGLGNAGGAVLGAVYVVGIPRLFPGSDLAPLLATGFGLLLVLLVRPGGLWSLFMGLRDSYVWALTVEDRAFKGPLSHLVPPDVPTAGRITSLFAPSGNGDEASKDAAKPKPKRRRDQPLSA